MSARTAEPMNVPLRALALALTLLLAACATEPARDRGGPGAVADPSPPAPQPGAAHEARSGALPGALRELGGIIELLQDGRNQEGRGALLAYLQREPGSALAKDLLQQLDADPQALLGAAHVRYVVQPGDTLGELAARELGDATRFVALARYNGIARPKALKVGQTLKIPSGRGKAAPAAQREATAQPDEALQHQQRGLALMQEGRLEAAHEAFGRALAQVPQLEPARRHRAALGKQLVGELHEAAVVHYRNQRLDEAIALWDKALALDPGFEPARGYRTRALELKRRLKALEAS